jgi:hypothetical protein
MTDRTRCDWDDIGLLLSDSAFERYRATACAEQQELNARFWWLADPLFSEPGNERLVEHDARRVALLLQSAFPTDGRRRWEDRFGRDALARMVLRYGPPSGVAWGGVEEDQNHSGWLQKHSAEVQPPYTTFEYSAGRVHTAPAWWAVETPFVATDSAWELNGDVDRSRRLAVWWPMEHFLPARPLLSLPPGQTAALPRDNDVLIATAHRLDGPLSERLGTDRSWVLVVTRQPGHFDTLDVRPQWTNGTATFRGRTPSGPSVLAVEVRGNSSAIDARFRQGVQAPNALSQLAAGAIAVSDPLLVQPLESSRVLQLGDSVVNLMLGSTNLRRDESRVGVYWESYGIRESDSVDVAIRVERIEQIGFLRRLRASLMLSRVSSSMITISWREPSPGRASRTLRGKVPIIGRSIILETGQLIAGDYELTVTMQDANGRRVSGRRIFTLNESQRQ